VKRTGNKSIPLRSCRERSRIKTHSPSSWRKKKKKNKRAPPPVKRAQAARGKMSPRKRLKEKNLNTFRSIEREKKNRRRQKIGPFGLQDRRRPGPGGGSHAKNWKGNAKKRPHPEKRQETEKGKSEINLQDGSPTRRGGSIQAGPHNSTGKEGQKKRPAVSQGGGNKSAGGNLNFTLGNGNNNPTVQMVTKESGKRTKKLTALLGVPGGKNSTATRFE